MSLPLDLVCDARAYEDDLSTEGAVRELWPGISEALAGKALRLGDEVPVALPRGTLMLRVVRAPADGLVDGARVRIVDVQRNPRLLYRCIKCGEYGPLRCSEGGKDERLCARDAHMLRDELTAYCDTHQLKCECRPDCPHEAKFRCARRECRKPFGDHYRRLPPNEQNPADPEHEYCVRCWEILYQQCTVCASLTGGRRQRIGRSRCGYRAGTAAAPCASALCLEHQVQWKIWGPERRGVILCPEHGAALATAAAEDLAATVLWARRTPDRAGRRASVPGPFGMRRIANRNRRVPLSLSQVHAALRALEPAAAAAGGRLKDDHRHLLERTAAELSYEATVAQRVVEFYRRRSYGTAELVRRVEVADRGGNPPRYRLNVYVATSDKRPFLGPGAALVKELGDAIGANVSIVTSA